VKLDDVFVALDPPPGGLARLRQRLAGEPARRRRQAWAALGVAAAVCLLALIGRARDPVLDLRMVRNYGALAALGLVEVPREPVASVHRDGVSVAVKRVATDPSLAVYLVEPR
jgi:hypothetical protein